MRRLLNIVAVTGKHLVYFYDKAFKENVVEGRKERGVVYVKIVIYVVSLVCLVNVALQLLSNGFIIPVLGQDNSHWGGCI